MKDENKNQSENEKDLPLPQGEKDERKEEGYVFDFGSGGSASPGSAYAPQGDGAYGRGSMPSGEGRGQVSNETYENRRKMFSEERSRPPKKKTGKIIGCCFGALAVAAAGFFAGYYTYYARLDPEMRSLVWAKERIQSQYYKEITDEEFYEAVYGAVNGLLDIYSGYLTADEFAESIEEATGKWSGLGLIFSTRDAEANNRMLISRVSGNSPAEEAGLLPGMYVVGFGKDEESVKDSTSFDEFSEFLDARETGEEFVLKLTDGQDGEPFFQVIAKESFVENYVFYRSNDSAYIFKGENATVLTEDDNYLPALGEDTAYIRLTQFNGQAAEEFKAVMDVFDREGKVNLVLDLRSNGGGYMNILQSIASYFCKDSSAAKPVVAAAEYRSGRREEFKADGNKYYDYFTDESRICVLADNGTASASECLIGCMWDYGAIAYEDICLSERSGEAKTYGKGIMQTTIPHSFFGRPDAIKLTTARILWPVTGNCIHDRGVLPEDGARVVEENYEGDAEILAALEALGLI